MSDTTMADVLADHQHMYHSYNLVTRERSSACSCGSAPFTDDYATHLADALTAAGFGPVTDAVEADRRAQSWEPAARHYIDLTDDEKAVR